MRFQFCGNLPCPEWFIAESSVLTKITAIKLKLVVGYLINHLLEDVDITEQAYKLLSNSSFSVNEMNAILSTLEFVLRNCIMYATNDAVLNKELVDLGLPRENAESISKAYKQSRDKLLDKFSNEFLKLSSQPQLTYSVNQLISCSASPEGALPATLPTKFLEVSLKYKNVSRQQQSIGFILTEIRLDEMASELQKALDIIVDMEQPSEG